MPDELPRFCNKANCPNFKIPGRNYCAEHEAEAQKAQRERRGPTAGRGYGAQHRRLRLLVLHRDPVCKICGRALSTVLDHIIPFHGEGGSQWSMENLQGACVSCHNSKSGREGMRRMRER